MKHNLLKSLIISVILLMGVSNAWGNVVGVVCENPNDYTIKLNVQLDNQNWVTPTPTMRKTTITYNGKKFYQTSFAYNDNSKPYINCMQIQLWDESTHKGEKVPYTNQTHHDQFYGYVFDYDNDGKRCDHVASFKKDARLYFDATGWNETDIKLCIGHGFWQAYYQMNKIDNTNLYYGNPVDGWGDAIGICVVGNTTAAQDGQGFMIDVATKAKECTGLKSWSLNAIADNNAYLMINKGKAGEEPEMHYYASHYNPNSLNHTQTIIYSISRNGSTYSTPTSEVTPATINISSYKFTEKVYNSVSAETKTISKGTNTYTQQFIAARTATTTLAVDWGSLDPNYKFEGWYDENGKLLATNFAYTYNPIEENTIYARFKEAPSRTVYFKPNNVWKKPGDRFVAVWKGGEFNVAEEMQVIDCSEYYTYEIPGRFADDYQTILFKKIKSGVEEFDSFDKIDDEAGGISDLQIPATDNPNKLYDVTKVYLKPNDTWKNDGARFAAYFWVSGSSPVQEKWMSMYPSVEDDGTYYCDYPTDHAYDYVIFCRMNPAHTDNKFDDGYCWTKTDDLPLHDHEKMSHGNLFDINEGKWEGKWTTYNATTTVTLIADSHGTYRVTCSNGTSLTSALNENRTLSVPLNSTITIETVQPQPGYAQTHGARIKIGTNEKTNASLGTAYTICGETTIKGNFVTANPTTVYLKTDVWNNDNPTYVAHVWHDGGVQEYTMTGIGATPYTYYSCTIDPGYHSIVFFRKSSDGTTIWNKTKDLFIPVDNNILYTITSFGEGEGTPAEGTWGPLPNYTVTLGYCEFGRYGVVYDGKTYYSKDRSDVVIKNVPFGTELQILRGEPASDKYDGNLTYEITENDKKVKRNLTTSTYTVTQDVTIDDNFVTNTDITAYLGIPTALTDWTKNGNQNIDNHSMQELAVYIWKTDSYNQGFSMEETERGSYLYTIDGIAYYQFTITKGCNDFQFQLKDLNDAKGDNGKNSGYTYRKSQWHRFQIPLTDVNCFVLDVNNYGSDNSKEYTGYWTRLPQQKEGDYRLRYIEQTLTLVDGHPHTEEVYSHCSDVIKANDLEEKRTLYSLHIFNEMDEEKTYGGEIIQGLNNPAIVVEKWDGSQWVEQMRHMVFGPLRGDFSLAAMPGRRNESPIDPYDNGIENIKNDLKNIEAYSNSGTSFYIGKDNPEETDYKRYIENWGNDSCSGVWNFVVNRDDAGNINTQDPLLLEKTHRYDGTYYIRTIGTIGGWDNYTIPENHMTRTNISKTNSNFSHYFCKWLTKNVNVRYVIANDYNLAISDDLKADKTTLMGKPIGDNDKIVADDEELPTNVNVRFSWNEKTNFLHRAYLSGSTHVQDRFLVLGGSGDGRLLDKDGNDLKAGEDTGSDPRYGLNANEEIFQDISNWIYYTDVQMIPLAEVKLTALIKYKKDEQDKRIEQYFVGTSDEWNNTLLQGTNCNNKYLIRVLYDFKTNQMTSAYVPDRGENEDIEKIQTNLMLIRREEPNDDDSNVTQLVFNKKEMDNSNTRAYGVLELSKDRLVNDGKYNDLRRRLYWISFPFDVRIADVFGSCVYGQHWIIQSYNGQKRADNGYYYETTESNWEYHFDPNTINEGDPIYEGVLKKGVGYVVALNLYNIWKDQLLENTKDAICLYFPSKDLISADIVQNQKITIDVPYHKCTKPGREIADSHWNVIGVPAYKNAGVNFTQEIDLSTDFAYYYRWDKAHNAYTPMANFGKEDDEKFSTLHAYMVQYHGELNWTGVLRESNQQHLAARKDVDNQKEYNLRLEVQKNGTELDRTFVKLQEDDVTALFDFNYDLCKITNAGANIYSFTSDATPIKVAGNVQPLAEDIVIPVGVVIDQAGDYTFSMPDGTAGIEVQLIDYQTNEKTNLLFGDYTINLPKGTFDNRFALLINPDKTATSVENINGNTENGANGEGVKKYIIDGQLYLQQGSALYDAQGHTVR